MFLILTNGWQHKARELDMITRNLDMICIICRNDVTGAAPKIHCTLSTNQKRDSEFNV